VAPKAALRWRPYASEGCAQASSGGAIEAPRGRRPAPMARLTRAWAWLVSWRCVQRAGWSPAGAVLRWRAKSQTRARRRLKQRSGGAVRPEGSCSSRIWGRHQGHHEAPVGADGSSTRAQAGASAGAGDLRRGGPPLWQYSLRAPSQTRNLRRPKQRSELRPTAGIRSLCIGLYAP
jgi:hypothetical protein